jgi:WD40 repeat protein
MRTNKIASFVLVSILAFAAIFPFIGQAAPTLSDELDAVKNKYTFNGNINAAVTDGDTLYLGGSFTSISRTTGQAVLLDDATGDISKSFPEITTIGGDTVYAAISDGLGGWYVAGDFTHIDGIAHEQIAHFLSDGTLDSDFETPVSGSAIVYSLLLSSDGETLYIGKSDALESLIAVDAVTGDAISAFNPQVSGGAVYALAFSSDESTLYAGGAFDCVNGENTDLDGCLGTARNYLAAFNSATGAATAFDADVVGGAVRDLELSSDDDTLYIGGEFTAVNTDTVRGYVAAISTSDGTATAFDPIADDVVRSIELSADDAILYVGGDFLGINDGTARNRIAALDTSNGTATAFDPNVSASVTTLMLSADGGTLYAGGEFSSVNNGDAGRIRMASFNTETGVVTSFDANFSSGGYVYTISESYAGEILVAGSISGVEPTSRSEVAAIDLSTYELTDFNPIIFSGAQSVYALALSPDAGTLYIGGSFHHVNDLDTARNNLAAVDTTTGLVNAFDPDTNDTVYSLDVPSDGLTVYAAGAFTMVNTDQPRDYVAAFSSTNGAMTAFAPTLDDTAYALKLSS